MECFGRLGKCGYEFVDELSTHVVGGRDGGSMGRKGVFKERMMQIISVTAQVAISRRVARYRLALRERQLRTAEAGGSNNIRRGDNATCVDDRPTPMSWGWSLDAL